MAIKIKTGRALGALSMTPLIDVVFLLLIFFLVASRLSQEDRELDIPLPSAAHAKPMTVEPQEMVVNINDQGDIIVNSKLLRENEFEELLKKTLVDNPFGQSVVIRADRRVPVQAPVNVMDICMKHGANYSLSIADEGT